MGPEGMVHIAARKLLQSAESPEAADAMKKELADKRTVCQGTFTLKLLDKSGSRLVTLGNATVP
jgi:hypothetical protein